MTNSSHPARRTFVITAVAVLTVAALFALWKLRLVVALLFLSFMIASAMRPGVDVLARRRVPRIVAILAHYAVFFGIVGLLLWFVIPNLLHEVEHAIGNVPQTRADLNKAARNSTGLKHEVLQALQKELRKAPSFQSLVHPAIDITQKALEVLVGIFFVLACAVYWIYDRDRFVDLVVSFVPARKRRRVHDTWDLVELKLGAYVRASLLLIAMTGTVLSFSFWQIGLPYWLFLGIFAGVVELIPVVGPLIAGVAAVGVALTVSIQAAALTAVAVYGFRLLQDYVIQPKVMGNTVGVAPMAILVVVSAFGILFGAALVPLAVPFTAVLVTVLDVLVRGREPKAQEVPSVVMPSKPLGKYQEENEKKTRRSRAGRRTRSRTSSS
jgi:predicted PurR-regulated permease PerM